MIVAHKVESKNEEAHDKVRARSAKTTEPVKGTTEFGNQIAKLMAALTRAGQGNSPASVPNSPRQRGHRRGQMDRNTPGHPSSHNGWTGLGQTTSAHSVSAGHGTGTTGQGQVSWTNVVYNYLKCFLTCNHLLLILSVISHVSACVLFFFLPSASWWADSPVRL